MEDYSFLKALGWSDGDIDAFQNASRVQAVPIDSPLVAETIDFERRNSASGTTIALGTDGDASSFFFVR